MRTKIIEASNKLNWGKFLLGRFDVEWRVRTAIPDGGDLPLLRSIGMSDESLWVLDLQTCEGACFHPGKFGRAKDELNKHRIWVCPLFEPFLDWLYQQPEPLNLDALPNLVELTDAPFAMHGYRREGP